MIKLAFTCMVLANCYSWLITAEGLRILKIGPSDVNIFFCPIKRLHLAYTVSALMQLSILLFYSSTNSLTYDTLLNWLILLPFVVLFISLSIFFSLFSVTLNSEGDTLISTVHGPVKGYFESLVNVHKTISEEYYSILNHARHLTYQEYTGGVTGQKGFGPNCIKYNNISITIACKYHKDLGQGSIPKNVIKEGDKKTLKAVIINENDINIKQEFKLDKEIHSVYNNLDNIKDLNKLFNKLKNYIKNVKYKLNSYHDLILNIQNYDKFKTYNEKKVQNLRLRIENIENSKIYKEILEKIERKEPISKESLVVDHVYNCLKEIFLSVTAFLSNYVLLNKDLANNILQNKNSSINYQMMYPVILMSILPDLISIFLTFIIKFLGNNSLIESLEQAKKTNKKINEQIEEIAAQESNHLFSMNVILDTVTFSQQKMSGLISNILTTKKELGFGK